jgi:hypothetical protein
MKARMNADTPRDNLSSEGGTLSVVELLRELP